jgi:hypothetical protein
MSTKIYVVDNDEYEVSPNGENEFLTKMKAQGKTPVLREEEEEVVPVEGKENGDVTGADATSTNPALVTGTDLSNNNQQVKENTGSGSEDTSSESLAVTKPVVTEEEMDKSTRLMTKYKDEEESSEDFYNRVIPINDSQVKPIYNDKLETWENKTIHTSTVNGITKTSSIGTGGTYTDENGEPASEDAINSFEELTILNDMHQQALDIESRQAGQYDLSDSETIKR